MNTSSAWAGSASNKVSVFFEDKTEATNAVRLFSSMNAWFFAIAIAYTAASSKMVREDYVQRCRGRASADSSSPKSLVPGSPPYASI